MSLLEQGAYLRLLCCDWLNDGIPDDHEELSKMSGLNEGWFNGSSTRLLKCFEPHLEKPGFLRNPRLQKERIKQEEWRKKSREGGIKSGKVRRKPNKKAPSEPPLNHPINQTPTKDEPKGNIPVSSFQSSFSVHEVLQNEIKSTPQIGGGVGEPGSEPQNPNLAPLVGGDSPSLFPELGPGPEHKTKKTKASPKPKGWDPTPQQLRLGKLFGRRPITAWSSKELRAFREIEARAKDEAAKEGKKWEEVLNGEVDLIETVYQARRNEKPNYLRKSLEVLLNNWQGELDRATGYIEKSENQTRQGPNI